MKIVFAGTPDFAVPCLKTLIKNFDVCAVITRADKPAGRGKKIMPSPVKKAALKCNLNILTQPINQLSSEIKKLNPDLLVVAAYGQIISQEILEIPRYGAVNLHPSLLPKYRGPSPIQAAILNGDKKTGVSIIKMTVDLDAGPIIAQNKIKIAADETAGSLHDKLARLGAELLKETLMRWNDARSQAKGVNADRSNAMQQNDAHVTYTKKITPADAELDIKKPAKILERQIRAYNPYPGAYLQITNEELRIKRLKIWQAEIQTNSQFAIRNSSINKLKIYQNQPALICGDGDLLVLTKVQPEGKKIMSGKEFARGHLK